MKTGRSPHPCGSDAIRCRGWGAHRRRHWRVGSGNGRPSLVQPRSPFRRVRGVEGVGVVRLGSAFLTCVGADTLLGPEGTNLRPSPGWVGWAGPGDGLFPGGCSGWSSAFCYKTARVVRHVFGMCSVRNGVGCGGWVWVVVC